MIEKFKKANDSVNNGSSSSGAKPRGNRGIVIEDDADQPTTPAKSGCC